MARRVFFSFEYTDVSRAMVVRNCWVTLGRDAAGFIDSSEFEKLQRLGDANIRSWIDQQLDGTSVTAVLVGAKTCASKWVNYEIEASKKRGNGLLGIDISQINNLAGQTTTRCGRIPVGYDFHLWFKGEGHKNIGGWIDKAARDAGR
jgi:MTH538 TIR-like domain (DUF1863)